MPPTRVTRGALALVVPVVFAACQLPPSTPLVVDASPPQDAPLDVAPPPPEDARAPSDAGADASAGSDAAPACSTPIAADLMTAKRGACTFGRGALATDTLPITEAQRAAIPIKHIVVLMKENRSFDHLLGELSTSGQPATEPIPASFSNLDMSGAVVKPFELDTTCLNQDPGHQWDEMHRQVNHGAMDGFVTTAAATTAGDGHFVMGHYGPPELPFYYWLANTYALNDRHFPSVRSGTWPNRSFLLLGTADGVFCTFCGKSPKPTTPTIFDSLDRAHVSWGVYTDSNPFDGTLGWPPDHRGLHAFVDFQNALKDGSLPAVSFVDSIGWVEDEHPTADVQVGEAWTRLVYEAAVASPLWPSLALVWTYDEAGGFADHVPPPERACIARPNDPDDAPFFELGVRVPLVVISPWARAHSVSHVVQDHTAITRFIETVFGLPALTSRDANSPGLLDMFDFGCAPSLLHPPEAPAAGKEGCHGDIVLAAAEPSYASAPGLSIAVSFRDVPAPTAHDRIGIYRYPRGPMDVPSNQNPIEPVAWGYVGGGGHVVGAAPASGTVTLDASALASNGPPNAWPLPPGLWIVHYLSGTATADGHTPAASVLVEISR
ncbi:MAG TPA: alkaline phosphatase family protein [Polyangia bacterium]|nr:alkaline phosphatase family protein [Polyangia bacterium]